MSARHTMLARVALTVSLLLSVVAAQAQFFVPPFVNFTTAVTTATFDPATLTGGGSLSGGNLTMSSTGSASVVRSSRFANTKFYMEISVTTAVSGSGNVAVGVVDSSQATVTPTSIATVPIKMWLNRNDALQLNNGSSGAYGSNWGAGSVLSLAIDNTLGSGSGKVWVGQCSAGTITWPGAGNPGAGTGAMATSLTGNIGIIVNPMTAASFAGTANFGGSGFSCNPATNNASGFGNL